ncbi:SAM-dependent methyltransferase [Mesorhizobium sp. M1328]|uniref:class I SAM-dependent methyltransferase n=1 Tax=Mesorhizobium sp. M1328 TaxID=2957082 RepID=UPI003338A96A
MAMTREISSAQSPVVELGPGTGVFTRQLIIRGVPQQRIALVENAASLARVLRRQFPAAALLDIDATELRRCNPFDGEKIGTVISSLPLSTMPAWRVFAILYGAFHILRPGGAVYQFTYGWRCPVPDTVLDRIGLYASGEIMWRSRPDPFRVGQTQLASAT